MITKAKLIIVNLKRYDLIFSGLCFLNSLKVIRLARDAIKVPQPPMFTAGSSA